MNPLNLTVPRGAQVVYNSLYAEKLTQLLVPDILLVALPNDIFIDVGWYPEHDLTGEYCIRTYRGEWGNWLHQPIRTPNPQTVADHVEHLAAKHFQQPIVFIGAPGQRNIPDRVFDLWVAAALVKEFSRET
jgi:hypothetical protein